MSGFEANFHVHAQSIDGIKDWIKLIGEQNKGNNSNPTITINNHHYAYNFHYLNDIAEIYDVEYLPSFSIETKEGPEIIVFDYGKDGTNYLKSLQKSKEYYLVDFVDEMHNLEKPINIGRMLQRTGKRLHEVEMVDICEELADKRRYFYYKDIDNAHDAYINVVEALKNKVPMPLPKLATVLNKLKKAMLCVAWCSLNNGVSDIVNQREISAIIATHEEKQIIKNLGITKKVLFGDGKWID